MRTARQISAQAKALKAKATPIPLKPVVVDDCDDTDTQFNKNRIDKQFFIDRDGVIRKYTGDLKDRIISMHYRIADDLFPGMDYPDDYVCKKLGWILCGSTVYNTPICYKKPNATQIKTLIDLDMYSYLCFPYKGNMVRYNKYGILCDD